MALERTFSIVKPDGVTRNLIGEVYRRFEQAGLRVIAARMTHLSQSEAEGFYAVHRERPFFGGLVDFITSSPLVAVALEGPSAITVVRSMVGATRPPEAAPGTIRALGTVVPVKDADGNIVGVSLPGDDDYDGNGCGGCGEGCGRGHECGDDADGVNGDGDNPTTTAVVTTLTAPVTTTTTPTTPKPRPARLE